MRSRDFILATLLISGPGRRRRPPTSSCGGRRATTHEEDEAVREVIAAFEQESGKQVELVFHPEDGASRTRSRRRSRPGQPPDFAFGVLGIRRRRAMGLRRSARRSHGCRRPLLATCSIRMRSIGSRCSMRRRGGAASTGCRWVISTHHVHVWKSLLEEAGFTLEDIPKEWDAFWSFWCDQVQPAVRQALGRDDVWGVGALHVGRIARYREWVLAVRGAYEADYVTRDGRLVIDDPEVRQQAHQGDRRLHGDLPQGLHPARFGHLGRRRQQRAVPGAEHRDDAEHDALDPEHAQGERPDDYYENAVTIDWPDGVYGQPLAHR